MAMWEGSAPKVFVSFNVCGRRESTFLWMERCQWPFSKDLIFCWIVLCIVCGGGCIIVF